MDHFLSLFAIALNKDVLVAPWLIIDIWKVVLACIQGPSIDFIVRNYKLWHPFLALQNVVVHEDGDKLGQK